MRSSGVGFIFIFGYYALVTGFEECHWSKVTVGGVSSCPMTKTEFEERKKKKNCEVLSHFQNCTAPDNFKYHCVLNEFGNETVEVCGPNYVIPGYCTEYNTIGARIQPNYDFKCSSLTPPCDSRYNSTNAYQYKGCYAIKRQKYTVTTSKMMDTTVKPLLSTSDPIHVPTTDDTRFNLAVTTFAVICGVLVVVIVAGVILFKRKLTERSRRSKTEDEMEMLPGQVDPEQTYTSQTEDETNKSDIKQPKISIVEEKCPTNEKCPGKPYAVERKFTSVCLTWENMKNDPNKKPSYIVYIKDNENDKIWDKKKSTPGEEYYTVEGLIPGKEYKFKVSATYKDGQEHVGPDSDIITTRSSFANTLTSSCAAPASNNHCKYAITMKEKMSARNAETKTRQLIFGEPCLSVWEEKTIMLLGETGSGKSSLVDSMINYIVGVNFTDDFRFSVVTLEQEEEKKKSNQAVSQTEWITVYKIYQPGGMRVDYAINIIDTPGFCDTSGRDIEIKEQIHQLFTAKNDAGVKYIDAVCFVVKAPDARLTKSQKYIFEEVMSLFGKDIESNICTLITFCDNPSKPPGVLAALKDFPFGKTFKINNEVFSGETNDPSDKVAETFWEMGTGSFGSFFHHIKQLKTRSLQQTQQVLNERESLKITISSIRVGINKQLEKLTELKEKKDKLNKYKEEIKKNENFRIIVEESKLVKMSMAQGYFATNCYNCNVSCHEYCQKNFDHKSINCSVIDPKTGNCTICPLKCHWKDHKSDIFCFRHVALPVEKTFAEMKKKYKQAKGDRHDLEHVIKQMIKDIENLSTKTKSMMADINVRLKRLNEIALRPETMSQCAYIELLIESELRENRPGCQKRIEMLKELKTKEVE